MSTTSATGGTARVGDWIEVRGIKGQSSRRGQIVELLGSDEHERYRVRWDEQHESVLYPADGVMILPQEQVAGHRSIPGSSGRQTRSQ